MTIKLLLSFFMCHSLTDHSAEKVEWRGPPRQFLHVFALPLEYMNRLIRIRRRVPHLSTLKFMVGAFLEGSFL
ncbi:hypothetical protein ACE6H2_019176 [Prunus campanulata]